MKGQQGKRRVLLGRNVWQKPSTANHWGGGVMFWVPLAVIKTLVNSKSYQNILKTNVLNLKHQGAGLAKLKSRP